MLPTSAQEKLTTGIVIEVGTVSRVSDVTQDEVNGWLGKRVLWSNFAGETLFTEDDGDVLRLAFEDVLCQEKDSYDSTI